MTQSLRPKDHRLYTYLSDLADAGAECPTNRDLAEAMGCTSPTISDTLARLRDHGMIRCGGETHRRDLTIVATGRTIAGRTGDTKSITALPPGMAAIVPYDTTLDRARVHRMGSAAMLPQHYPEAGEPCWFCQSRIEACECVSGLRVRAHG